MIHVKIITPKGLYLECDAESVHVTTQEGETTILPNHMPMVAMLKISPCILTVQKETQIYAISEGLMQFQNNQMHILSDAVESQTEIDETRAQEAKSRAMERLAHINKDVEVERAQLALARALNRIEVKHR